MSVVNKSIRKALNHLFKPTPQRIKFIRKIENILNSPGGITIESLKLIADAFQEKHREFETKQGFNNIRAFFKVLLKEVAYDSGDITIKVLAQCLENYAFRNRSYLTPEMIDRISNDFRGCPDLSPGLIYYFLNSGRFVPVGLLNSLNELGLLQEHVVRVLLGRMNYFTENISLLQDRLLDLSLVKHQGYSLTIDVVEQVLFRSSPKAMLEIINEYRSRKYGYTLSQYLTSLESDYHHEIVQRKISNILLQDKLTHEDLNYLTGYYFSDRSDSEGSDQKNSLLLAVNTLREANLLNKKNIFTLFNLVRRFKASVMCGDGEERDSMVTETKLLYLSAAAIVSRGSSISQTEFELLCKKCVAEVGKKWSRFGNNVHPSEDPSYIAPSVSLLVADIQKARVIEVAELLAQVGSGTLFDSVPTKIIEGMIVDVAGGKNGGNVELFEVAREHFKKP